MRREYGLAVVAALLLGLATGCHKHYVLHPKKPVAAVEEWSSEHEQDGLQMRLTWARPPGDGPFPTVLVHPECSKEVVDAADLNGSTESIIRHIEQAPPGSHWAVGTEVHLVNRLAQSARARGVDVVMLSDCQCLCTTMYRIDPPHLLWSLDALAAGRVVNRIRVHARAQRLAVASLDRMLALVDPPAVTAVASA